MAYRLAKISNFRIRLNYYKKFGLPIFLGGQYQEGRCLFTCICSIVTFAQEVLCCHSKESIIQMSISP